MRAGAVEAERGEVRRGAVPRIIRPPILGEVGVQGCHQRITRDLGDNARRRNRQAGRIAPYNALNRNGKITWGAVAVDQGEGA